MSQENNRIHNIEVGRNVCVVCHPGSCDEWTKALPHIFNGNNYVGGYTPEKHDEIQRLRKKIFDRDATICACFDEDYGTQTFCRKHLQEILEAMQ